MKITFNKNGQFKKVIWSEKDKKLKSLKMSGRKNPFYGKKHTKKTRKRLSKNHQGKKKSQLLCEHHIYLKENNSKTIKLTNSKHHILHWKAYNYLVEINQIDDYIKWFDKKYGLK